MPGGLKEGWDEVLDKHFEELLKHPSLAAPGFVVYARSGDCTYQNACGQASPGVPMDSDAQMRCFSMTKALASATALYLQEKGALNFDDEVKDYIPSFDRTWDIVSCPEESTGECVTYESFLTGDKMKLNVARTPAQKTHLVKHLAAEASGIGYDMWTDLETRFGLPLGKQYGAVQEIRRPFGAAYSSTNIIGQDATLTAYVDSIAAAGVLVCEPGTFSYGLGALVLGRVCEVAWERLHGSHMRFADIVDTVLFRPLGMETAAFYLPDGDSRASKMPALYGAKLRDANDPSKGADVKLYADCLPPSSSHVVTIDKAHMSGPRSCDSGDTGATMSVADFARFYEMILAKGLAPDGKTRVLSEVSVRALTHDGFGDAIDFASSPMAGILGLDGVAKTFGYGWAVTPAAKGGDGGQQQHMCEWGGYALNKGWLFPDNDAYILIFPAQIMMSTDGAFPLGPPILQDTGLALFLKGLSA